MSAGFFLKQLFFRFETLYSFKHGSEMQVMLRFCIMYCTFMHGDRSILHSMEMKSVMLRYDYESTEQYEV